jgi:chemotaxis protein MotB
MRTKSNYHSQAESESQRDRWMISYADLVTLLLALFIVMFAASDKERAKLIADSFSGQNTAGSGVMPGSGTVKDDRAQEQMLLDDPVLSRKTKIRQTDRGLVVSLAETGFFAPGDAFVGAEADRVVAALAESIKNSPMAVRVEGHTDSVPISTARYASNWELSTARAANVLQKLIEKGIAPERLSASGYGGFQPVADNALPEGRAQNRRVDVVILNR